VGPGGRRYSLQAPVDRGARQVADVRETELLLDPSLVGFDGLDRHGQLPGNVAVPRPPADEREDFTFPIGEALKRVSLPETPSAP
jgi:hypothetical protein